jgi:hypothetical protein
MTNKLRIVGALGAGLLIALGGCEKSDNTTPATTPPAQSPKPAPQASETTPSASDAANAATGAAGTAAKDASTAAQSAAASAGAAAQHAAETAAPATQPAAPGSADGEAQTMLNQAMTYIKENKYDLADKTLTKLEGMKASLSPTLQKGVAQARTALNAAKAGGGVKLPALGQ